MSTLKLNVNGVEHTIDADPRCRCSGPCAICSA